MNTTPTVDHLNKVTLILHLPSSDEQSAGPPDREFTFIYGIGTQGLTPFEQQLHNKTRGERMTVHVSSKMLHVDFEHLSRPMLSAAGIAPPFDLEIEIKSVCKAKDLEVVKALAEKGESGGCGGLCGCGC